MRIIISDGKMVRCIQNIQGDAKIEIVADDLKSFQINDEDMRYQTWFIKAKEVE